LMLLMMRPHTSFGFDKRRTVYVTSLLVVSERLPEPGLLSSIFWEQGFNKVPESSRTLELFEQFDLQFRKWRTLLVSMVLLVQNMLVLSYMYIICFY
jgi:hypothetical protein